MSMLYAQHAWLMKRISHTFSSEITSFLDDVRDRVRTLSLPRRLQETVAADGCRFWWIGSRHDGTQRRIYLRVDPHLPQIVWPGELHLEIRCSPAWNCAEDSKSCHCAQLMELPGTSTSERIIISYDQHFPIESAANHVASLLTDCESLNLSSESC